MSKELEWMDSFFPNSDLDDEDKKLIDRTKAIVKGKKSAQANKIWERCEKVGRGEK